MKHLFSKLKTEGERTMKFESALWTDIGVERETNQDSMCIKHALTEQGEILMGVVCDGMGGLELGELASAEVVRAFDNWFETELPGMLSLPDYRDEIRYRWERIIQEQNQNILEYGREHRITLGTTVTAMLFFPDGQYILAHAGDTRAYRITNWSAELLTQDHTLVAQMVRDGRITEAQADNHPDRNVLVRCIGVSRSVRPDILCDCAQADECYLLCSDGFRHEVSRDEFQRNFAPDVVRDESELTRRLEHMTRVNIERGEMDNVSALVIKLS